MKPVRSQPISIDQPTAQPAVARRNTLLPRPRLAGLLLTAALTGCANTPPPTPSPVLQSARRDLDQNQPDLVLADAGTYLRNNPSGPEAAEAYYFQGRAYEQKAYGQGSPANSALQRQSLTSARSAYVTALQHGPQSELEGTIRASLSNVTFNQDDFADSIQSGTEAIPLVQSVEVKRYLLYRIGVSQQRLGRFEDADQTFRQVMQMYPGTTVAAAAQDHLGQRTFYVQLGTYENNDQADRELSHWQSGNPVTRQTNRQGHVVLDIGPFNTFQEARTACNFAQRDFPDAIIIPLP